jgi:ABC-type multidrug transport system fused ATPase/permease subunit
MQSHSDTRLKYIKELLTAIKIVKFYAWEKPFLRHIHSERESQLKYTQKTQLTRAFLVTVLSNVGSIGMGLTFLFYGIGHTMTTESTFSAMTYITMLRAPFNCLPMVLAYLGEYLNSFERITYFSLCSEITPRLPDSDPTNEKGMRLENATFSWETELSIAESRYMDAELQESNLIQRIEITVDQEQKAQLIDELKSRTEEKEHFAKLVRILRLRDRQKSAKQDFPSLSDDSISQDLWSEEEEEFITPQEEAKFPIRRVTPALKDVNLNVRHASLTAIVGSVGSGKSTIGMAFLGEIAPVKGSVFVSSQIAYSSQEPWILNATVRDNITFGIPYEPKWYAEVVHACALAKDLASLPAGDLTEIGERGSTLSGGQRQRLNVARAMYSNSPIVILDDPFSALDSHVGAHLFQNVALGMRNAGRTVLLITNQLHLVPDADYIAVVKAGSIVEQGTYPILARLKKGYLKKMLASHVIRNEADGDEKSDPDADDVTTESNDKELRWEPSDEQDEENRNKGILIHAEERRLGTISSGTYWHYFKAGGIIPLFLIFLMQALRMASRLMSGIWLSWWSDTKNAHGFTHAVYLGGYISFILGEALFTLLAALAFVTFGMGAARVLHHRMMLSVSRAPLSWFEQTPIGRSLGRFSTDVDYADVKLPQVLEQVTASGFRLLAVGAAFALGSYWVTILLAFALIGFAGLIIYYRRTGIQLQRLEALSRGPIYSHLTEAIEGAVTIRAYRATETFKIANMNKLDRNTVDFVALRYCTSWYYLTQDLVATLFVTGSMIVLIFIRHYFPNTMSIGYISLALSNFSSVSAALSDFSTAITDLENNMNSAERVLEYSELPSETVGLSPIAQVPIGWPDKGSIIIRNLTIKYSEDQHARLALDDVSCDIKPRERIGIVGRTGSGKSTLVSALFRILEPAKGRIKIDGIDLSQIGLHDLRSHLSIIPQSPQLFVGSVRYNLDPLEEHSDHELWQALALVRLKDHVASLPACLSELVDEGGTNFSIGQRQLLSMARCLLKGTRVLVMDEATSSVDVETDALLQSMVRNRFENATVLMIAHRLNTIMDSDRIMVLDAGKIVEFDTPANLLSRDSFFKSMVDATGPDTAEYLRSIAFGEISFMDALATLVEDESDQTSKSENVVKRKRRSFQTLSRKQQSRLLLGYYRVQEEDVIEIAKAKATPGDNATSPRRGSIGRRQSIFFPIIRSPSFPPISHSESASSVPSQPVRTKSGAGGNSAISSGLMQESRIPKRRHPKKSKAVEAQALSQLEPAQL